MTKFGCHVIVLAYFWYSELIFIFRGPIYGLFELFTNIWQPWKWNLTSYYCSGSLKTHESEFCFSGLPNFDGQGCHISLGCNCPNSIPAQDDGQITSLKHPTVGIHGKFCHTFIHFVLDCALCLYSTVAHNGMHKARGRLSDAGRTSSGSEVVLRFPVSFFLLLYLRRRCCCCGWHMANDKRLRMESALRVSYSWNLVHF